MKTSLYRPYKKTKTQTKKKKTNNNFALCQHAFQLPSSYYWLASKFHQQKYVR